MKLLTKVYAIYNRIVDLGAAATIVLIFASMLLVAREVLIMRMLLDSPQAWVIDITSFGLVFITFLSTAWVLKKDRHVKMDLLLMRLNPRAQLVLNTITSIVGAILCLILTWYGIQACLISFQEGTITPEYLQVPMYTLYFIIPVGLFLLSIQFLVRANSYLRGWREAIKKDQM